MFRVFRARYAPLTMASVVVGKGPWLLARELEGGGFEVIRRYSTQRKAGEAAAIFADPQTRTIQR